MVQYENCKVVDWPTIPFPPDITGHKERAQWAKNNPEEWDTYLAAKADALKNAVHYVPYD